MWFLLQLANPDFTKRARGFRVPQEVCGIVCFAACVKIVLKYAPHWGEVRPRAVPGNAVSSVQAHIGAQGSP
jgi:hypothetical protein